MPSLVDVGRTLFLIIMLVCVYLEAGPVTVVLFLIVLAEIYAINDSLSISTDNNNIILSFLDGKFKEFEVRYEDDEVAKDA